MIKGINMDCKEFEKQIPDFIARKLDYLALKRFCEHMEKCEDCKEELVIRFLVTEGIHRLEDGSAFDLQSELEQRLGEARRRLRFYDRVLRFGVALEILAAAMFIGIAVWILI